MSEEKIDEFLDALVELMQAKIADSNPDNGPDYVGFEHSARRRASFALHALLNDTVSRSQGGSRD